MYVSLLACFTTYKLFASLYTQKEPDFPIKNNFFKTGSCIGGYTTTASPTTTSTTMTTTTTSTTTTSPTTTAYNLCQLDPSDPCANHASQVEYCAQLEDMATFMDVGIFCIMDGLTNCCPVVCKVEGCTPPPTTTTTTTTDPSVTTFLCDTSDCSSNSAKG